MHLDSHSPKSKSGFFSNIPAYMYKKAVVAIMLAGFITTVPDAFAQTQYPPAIKETTKIDMNWSKVAKPLQPHFAQLRAKLRPADEFAALYALQIALSRVGDGQSFVWGRPKRKLRAVITPVSSFRAQSGDICRKIVFTMSLGNYAKRIKTTACRAKDNSWKLQS